VVESPAIRRPAVSCCWPLIVHGDATGITDRFFARHFCTIARRRPIFCSPDSEKSPFGMADAYLLSQQVNRLGTTPESQIQKRRIVMLYWALVFLIVALVAGAFGFGGIYVAAAGIAKVLFFIFLVLFLVSLVAGGWSRRSLP
jgi:uncharacterized membrane protein YtjA (UPF0391 family)